MNQDLTTAISELEEERALSLVNDELANGCDPMHILGACNEAMAIVGDRFERNEYYLAELMMAGELLKQISDIIRPELQMENPENVAKGPIVIGTVRGDVHNIGKDIIIFMLEANGYKVYDLGVDVPEEEFVRAIREYKPQMLCLSGLLTSIFPVFKTTIEAITEAGLRDQVKIAIGGGQVDERVFISTGADGYGTGASVAITLANQWIE